MHNPHTYTKKTSSLLPNIPVKRQRLFEVLNSAESRNVWISGPAGSGKSTLIGGFLQERGAPSIFYQVDALDNDPATCFLYLGEAVRSLTDNPSTSLPLLTPEYLPNIEIFLLQYFERLFQCVPAGTWLVFDNVENAPEHSLITQVLTAAVQQISGTCRLAIISRQEPVPAMTRFLANQMIKHIGWKDLAFTCEELTVLLEREKVQEASRQAARLFELTKGWVAGAILWLLHVKENSIQEEAFGETPERVFSYFAGEILEKVEGETRDFLVQTSQLPFMTKKMVEDLIESPVPSLLDLLRQKNFFVETRWARMVIYQYHPLFHAYLKKTAETLLSEDSLNDLRLRSARILEKSRYLEDAIELYASIRAHEDIASVVLARAKNLVAEGRYLTLSNWISYLPEQMIQQNPHLLYWSGIACMTTTPQEGVLSCIGAYKAFQANDDFAGQIRSWSTVVESFIMMRGGFVELDFWISEGERLEKDFHKIDDESAALFSSSMLIALLLRNQGHPDLPLWQARCESLLDTCRKMQAMSILVSSLYWSYHYLGDVRGASIMETRLKLVLSQPGIPAIGTITINTLLALAAVGRGDHKQCMGLVHHTLEIAEKNGLHSYDHMLIAFGVYTGLSIGDLAMAKTYLDKMKPLLAPHALWDYGQYYFLIAWYHVENGDSTDAQKALSQAAVFIDTCGNPYTMACVKILQANLQLDNGEPVIAEKTMANVLKDERLSHNKIIKLVTYLTLADCAFEKQDLRAATGYFHNALDIVKKHGLTMPFPLINRRIGHVAALALNAGIHDEILADMIDRWKLRASSAEITGEKWPWPIKFFTFGGLRMFEHNRLVAPSTKPPRKLFELLILLIMAKRSGIPRDTAAYRLWPDSDGDKAIQNLNTTLHRLRKLLRDEGAILLQNGKLLLNPQKCWADCWHFEWLEQRASSQDVYTAGSSLIQGLKLYKGAFVPEHNDFQFASAYGETLRRGWLNMITEAKVLLQNEGAENIKGRLSQELVNAQQRLAINIQE